MKMYYKVSSKLGENYEEVFISNFSFGLFYKCFSQFFFRIWV